MMLAFALAAALSAASPPPPAQAASPPSAGATSNPFTIYHRAIAAMRAADVHRPPYAIYQLDYTGHNLVVTPNTVKGKTGWDMELHHANDQHSYQVWYRVHDDKALTQDAATHAAYRGEALLAPFDANALDGDKPSPAPSGSPSPMPTGNSGSPGDATTQVLGAVTAEASRFYDITLVGLESRDGQPVYHLHLRAKSDIEDHPLTDLYVDTTSYLVRAAHAEVTLRGVVFALGIRVDVAYEPVGTYWLLDNLHLHGSGYALFYHANMECTMVMHDFQLPAALPDSYFTVPAPP